MEGPEPVTKMFQDELEEWFLNSGFRCWAAIVSGKGESYGQQQAAPGQHLTWNVQRPILFRFAMNSPLKALAANHEHIRQSDVLEL